MCPEDDDNLISRLAEEPAFLTPRARKGLPCCVVNYCSRLNCKKRAFVREDEIVKNAYLCLKEKCRRRLYLFPNEEVPVKFCINSECRLLGKGKTNWVCLKFRKEMARRPAKPMPSGHRTLRLNWKAGGWTYRRV
jgi:hypothetical protein